MVCKTCRCVVQPEIVRGTAHCPECRASAKRALKAKDRLWDAATAAILALVVGVTVASAVFRFLMGWPL